MAGVSQSSGFCSTCGEQRLFAKQKPNHVLHLVLSLITVGAWCLLVWIPLTVIAAVKGSRCSVCGVKKGGGQAWTPPPQVP